MLHPDARASRIYFRPSDSEDSAFDQPLRHALQVFQNMRTINDNYFSWTSIELGKPIGGDGFFTSLIVPPTHLKALEATVQSLAGSGDVNYQRGTLMDGVQLLPGLAIYFPHLPNLIARAVSLIAFVVDADLAKSNGRVWMKSYGLDPTGGSFVHTLQESGSYKASS